MHKLSPKQKCNRSAAANTLWRIHRKTHDCAGRLHRRCSRDCSLLFEQWSERRRRSNRVNVQNFVAIGHTIAEIWWFLDFSTMAAVRHLEFVMRMFGLPKKGIWWFGGLYRCAKFGWNIDAVVLIICMFFSISRVWLENAYSRTQNCFFWIGLPEWGAISTKPQSEHLWASPRRLRDDARKSIDGFDW